VFWRRKKTSWISVPLRKARPIGRPAKFVGRSPGGRKNPVCPTAPQRQKRYQSAIGGGKGQLGKSFATQIDPLRKDRGKIYKGGQVKVRTSKRRKILAEKKERVGDMAPGKSGQGCLESTIDYN